MLDAVRELGSFIVQRQNISPISHHIRPTKDMQSRFPMRVRSKSTTHDDSISHGRDLTVRMGHSLKSVRRPTSLTKGSKSPIKRSVSPYPVIDTEDSCCSKHVGYFKGVDMSQRETKYRLPVKNDTSIASNQETENVQASEVFTHPEIACLEAELSHRDTLIKYLSEQLFKLYQDNDRIFAEYELQEANLTKYLRSLRSRLTETNSNLNQQYTTHNTTNNTNSIHTDYITNITQSISQDININITDSILHHFAKEINTKIINPGINNNNNDNDVIVTMTPIQRIKQSFISELQDLNLATQNLLNYWEIKNHEMNYSTICQQFFNALLNFCIISMNSYQFDNQFIDPNINDLQMKANHAEQQIIDLSNEIKQYQIQLNQLNEKLQKNQLKETNHHLLISDYFLSSTNSSSNNNIINYLSDTDQTQCILSSSPSPSSSSSLLLLDPGSSSQIYESIPKIKSLEDQTIFPLKSTIMPIDISTSTTTTTIPVYNSINNLLQRLWGMLSKESKLTSTDLHKSKLWISSKEDYDTLYEAYNIIEQFQWYIQNNKLSSFKSSSLVESQSSLSTTTTTTTATYFAPESVAIEINGTNAIDKSIPVDVPSITNLTDQSTITALTSNQHKIKDIEEVNLESFKREELSSCTKYETKSIYLTDMCTSTSDLLTLFINKDQNYQLNIQQFKQMNDQIISTDDLIQTSSLEKEALRELQKKFNYLKNSYHHLISQYQTFNQTLSKQLKYINLVFDKYKSVYISYKYKDLCDSSIQTDSFNHLHRLTDPSYKQISLDDNNLSEIKYCHSSWPINELISNETNIYNQSILNNELLTNNYSIELSQLKQNYEILQLKLQKSEKEVEMLRNNLLDIKNYIKLTISNKHFTSLQCLLDNEELSDVKSLTKAFLNQVDTIISNFNQYIPDQKNQIEYELPDQYFIDDKSLPIHNAKHLLVNTEEYDQQHPIYSAEQSLIRLTELQEILQQQIIRKQNTFVEQIEQDNYSFNREMDKLLDDKHEITDLELTEKLQSALHVIYEELSLCQHLVDKLLSEKTKHCKLIAMQASQIEDLNKELRQYDYKLKAISRGHNIVPHNTEKTYENNCYETNDEKVKSEYYKHHHDQYPNSLIDSSTNPNKNIINELKLTNQTEIEQTTIMSTLQQEYLTIAEIEETKSTLAKDTLSTLEFTDQSTRSPVEMTREKLVSSSLCEDES
ncbi:unnamed protein product, partial [Schistosoma margrebowiei]